MKTRREIPSKLLLKAGPHPNGIKPLGNQLLGDTLASSYADTRSIGLGHLNCLEDHLIYAIFSNLSAGDLARLSMVSRAMYCWSYHDEFWKPLVLKDLVRFQWYGKTWRQTYHGNQIQCLNDIRGFDGNGNSDQLEIDDLVGYRPLRIPFFYSDVLFQSWFCSSIGILDEWLRTDNIDRVSQLSKEDFVRLYEHPNKPVVIKDAIDKWNAMNWTRDILCERFGQIVFRAEAMDTKLENYFKYADNTLDESPMYLFDKFFSKNCLSILQDYQVPEYFSDDLFSVLGEHGRPDYRWLIVGPAKSGSNFHKDPNATSAWNATISGSKKWIMFPPETIPPGVIPSNDGSEVTTPGSIIEWFANFYRQAQKMKPVECITRPGDLIFVPSGWWHLVINLESPTVAITQNYVSKCNLGKVLNFLKNKKDQISGICSDDVETLGIRFEAALKVKYPELFQALAKDNLTATKSDETKTQAKRSFWSMISQQSLINEVDDTETHDGEFRIKFSF